MTLRINLRPRWRKVLYDLWDNKLRTLLVVSSIAVGVFAIGVIAGAYIILLEDLNTSYASVNPANIELVTDAFDTDFIQAVRRLDSVAEAEGRRQITLRLRVGEDKWDSLYLAAIPDFEDTHIKILLPQQGQAAPRDQEILLERKTLAKLKAAVGDVLEVELPDNKRRRMRITGSAQDLTSGYGGILGDLQGYITLDTLEWLQQPDSLNRLYITVAQHPNDLAHIEQVARQVTDQLEKSGRQVYRTELSQRNRHPMDSLLQALLGVLGILGVLIVFLSGSLIANTMSALLAQHMRQIGVMKLIGARRGQLIGMYLVLITAFGLIALLIAVPLGSWGAYALSSFAADVINFAMSGFRITPLAVALQIAIALLIPPAAGMLSILRGSAVTIHTAIHSAGLGEEEINAIRRERRSGQAGRVRWISRPLLISIRNTFRRKGRLALTLLTLTLGGAIFIAVFNSREALNQKVFDITRYFRADVNLDFARSYRVDKVAALAQTTPGVTGVEVWSYAGAELIHADGSLPDNVSLIAPPADSVLITPVLLQGRWLLPGDQNAIAINEAFWSDYPDLQAGSRLRLKIAGREKEWVVVGVYQYTGANELIAYVNYDYLAMLLKQPTRSAAYRIVTSQHSLAFQAQVSAQLDRFFRQQGFQVSKVEAGNTTAASVTNMMGLLTAFLLIMAMLTALVGCIGLTGTMSMNVLERTREIGVLRAIGGYDWFVIRLVLVEGLIIGLISFVLASLLSFPITRLLSNTISLAIFNSPAEPAFTVQGFGVWLVIVLVLSALASVLPAYNASRLTIREVLAYE